MLEIMIDLGRYASIRVVSLYMLSAKSPQTHSQAVPLTAAGFSSPSRLPELCESK
jgi:hypothetical protein